MFFARFSDAVCRIPAVYVTFDTAVRVRTYVFWFGGKSAHGRDFNVFLSAIKLWRNPKDTAPGEVIRWCNGNMNDLCVF